VSSFSRLATQTAHVKAPAEISGGKRGEAALVLSDVACTPLDPISEETARRFGIETPYTVRECYVDSALTIGKGHVLVVDDQDYPIRAAEPWEWRGGRYLRLVVEVLQR
jgi:hypothetical protein